jgi:hypothetical protein
MQREYVIGGPGPRRQFGPRSLGNLWDVRDPDPPPAECSQPSRGRKADSDIGNASLVKSHKLCLIPALNEAIPIVCPIRLQSWCEGAKDYGVSALNERI